MILWWWAALALGTELQDEVARAHLDAGETVLARQLATEAVQEEPSATAVEVCLAAAARRGSAAPSARATARQGTPAIRWGSALGAACRRSASTCRCRRW